MPYDVTWFAVGHRNAWTGSCGGPPYAKSTSKHAQVLCYRKQSHAGASTAPKFECLLSSVRPRVLHIPSEICTYRYASTGPYVRSPGVFSVATAHPAHMPVHIQKVMPQIGYQCTYYGTQKHLPFLAVPTACLPYKHAGLSYLPNRVPNSS